MGKLPIKLLKPSFSLPLGSKRQAALSGQTIGLSFFILSSVFRLFLKTVSFFPLLCYNHLR